MTFSRYHDSTEYFTFFLLCFVVEVSLWKWYSLLMVLLSILTLF